jgi:hypothetical protein
MYPNWHGKPYRSILKHYGIAGLWHQFWYDMAYWWRNGGHK